MIDHLFNLVHDQHCDSCPVLWEGWYLYLSPECLQVLTDFTDRRSCLERDRESNIKALNTIPQQQAAVYIYVCVPPYIAYESNCSQEEKTEGLCISDVYMPPLIPEKFYPGFSLMLDKRAAVFAAWRFSTRQHRIT